MHTRHCAKPGAYVDKQDTDIILKKLIFKGKKQISMRLKMIA